MHNTKHEIIQIRLDPRINISQKLNIERRQKHRHRHDHLLLCEMPSGAHPRASTVGDPRSSRPVEAESWFRVRRVLPFLCFLL